MKNVWAIRNANGEVVNTVTLPAGEQPTLEQAHEDPVLGLIPGQTAAIIDTINEPNNADVLAEMLSQVEQKASDARAAIMSETVIAGAMLKRAKGGTVTALEKTAITDAEARLAGIETDLEAFRAEIAAAMDTNGITLPEWAKN